MSNKLDDDLQEMRDKEVAGAFVQPYSSKLYTPEVKSTGINFSPTGNALIQLGSILDDKASLGDRLDAGLLCYQNPDLLPQDSPEAMSAYYCVRDIIKYGETDRFVGIDDSTSATQFAAIHYACPTTLLTCGLGSELTIEQALYAPQPDTYMAILDTHNMYLPESDRTKAANRQAFRKVLKQAIMKYFYGSRNAIVDFFQQENVVEAIYLAMEKLVPANMKHIMDCNDFQYVNQSSKVRWTDFIGREVGYDLTEEGLVYIETVHGAVIAETKEDVTSDFNHLCLKANMFHNSDSVLPAEMAKWAYDNNQPFRHTLDCFASTPENVEVLKAINLDIKHKMMMSTDYHNNIMSEAVGFDIELDRGDTSLCSKLMTNAHHFVS